MRPFLVIIGLWVAWALSWLAAAAWSAPAQKSVRFRSTLGYQVPTALGYLMMVVPAHRYEGPLRLWHVGRSGAWICIALIVLGFAFTWWARIYLGPLWSGRVTKKAEHTVVDTGPYAVVRHPIYTGLLLSLFATAAAKGTILGLGGAGLMTLGLWLKARLEERWLATELGGNAYAEHRRRVPMLLPFGPKSK